MYSDLNTAKVVITPKEKMTSLDLNTDGTKLAAGSTNGNLVIWDVKNNYNATVYTIFSKGNDILAVSFLPNSNTEVVIGDENGEVRLVNNGFTAGH